MDHSTLASIAHVQQQHIEQPPSEDYSDYATGDDDGEAAEEEDDTDVNFVRRTSGFPRRGRGQRRCRGSNGFLCCDIPCDGLTVSPLASTSGRRRS